jgi:hypothetical protein
MSKNKKNQPAAVRFGPALKAFVLCALIGGSGIGYVWQKTKLDELYREIKKREVALGQLKAQNQKLRENLAFQRLPGNLNRRVRELNLGLVEPLPTQIWRMPEPVAHPPVDVGQGGAEPGRQLAVQ